MFCTGSAQALEMMFPKAKPAVAFDVPEDWTIEKVGKTLEMRSPQKDAIVVADVISREKATLDAWAKQASLKLKTFGVAFDPQAKSPPKDPAAAHLDTESAFTKSPDAFTFTGKPSLAMPGTPDSNDPVKPGKTSIESLTAKGPEIKDTKPMPKLPFKAVQYYGTTLNGKPVDVQLVIYSLEDKRLFVMMQESGPDDSRAVAIATSVRGAKARPKASEKPSLKQ